MSCIVYQTDKRTGIKYAYESVSYWDKEKKQPRSKRKYLGRVDPETGEIIKAHRKKIHDMDSSQESRNLSQLQEELALKDSHIKELEKELENLTLKYQEAEKTIEKIASCATLFLEET